MERSPFASIFNPDNPTGSPFGNILGTIGQISGVQTSSERAANANAEMLMQLNQMVQQGQTPQKAFVNFLATPEGREVFARGGAVDLAKQWMATISETPNVQFAPPGTTPVTTRPNNPNVEIGQQTQTTEQGTARTIPPVREVAPGNMQTVLQNGQFQPNLSNPTSEVQGAREGLATTNLPPGSGQQVWNPATRKWETQARTPTTSTQDFQAMREIANLPPDLLSRVASAHMLPAPFQQQEAIDQAFKGAVRNGSMDQATADKLRFKYFGEQGAIRVVPKYNRVGEQVGNSIVDLSNPGVPRVMDVGTRPGGATQVPAPGGATAPAGSPAADVEGSRSDYQQARTPKSTMFFGTGLAPAALSTFGQIVRGSIGVDIPIPKSEESAADIRSLNSLQTALAQLSRLGEGLGIPAKLVQATADMGPKATIWSDPKVAVTHAIDLYANLQDARNYDIRILNDVEMSSTEKKHAEARIQSYDNVLRQLPPLTEMTALKKDMDAFGPITQKNSKNLVDMGRAGFQGATGAGERVRKDVSEVAGETKGSNAKVEASRFSGLSNEQLLAVEPKKLNPTQLQMYNRELTKRRDQFNNRGK